MCTRVLHGISEYTALSDIKQVSLKCFFVRKLSKFSFLVAIIFNLDIGWSSPAECNSKLPEFESRTNPFLPSNCSSIQMTIFIRFTPTKDLALAYGWPNYTDDNLLIIKCPFSAEGSVSPSREKVPASGHCFKEISAFSQEILLDDVYRTPSLYTVFSGVGTEGRTSSTPAPGGEWALFLHDPRGTARGNFPF